MGFKPMTFRTFFFPDISYKKLPIASYNTLGEHLVTPMGFKPMTFRTGI